MLGKVFQMKDFEEKRKFKKKTSKDLAELIFLKPEESELLYPVAYLGDGQYDLILDNHIFPGILFLTEKEIDNLDYEPIDIFKIAEEKRAISIWMLLALGIDRGNK